MFNERGYSCNNFDIYYAPDECLLNRQYDFITATEVIEHLSQPAKELDRLWSLLKPGGWLGLMTKRVTSLEAFARWHYKNDPTHICFYSLETFAWLGRQWGVIPKVAGDDVVLFQKGGTQTTNRQD